MNRVAIMNVVGLTPALIGNHTPRIRSFRDQGSWTAIKPSLPAVTCTAQANYLTGRLPSKHGIVGNGWYDRALAEVQFWKQSNRLVQAPKVWETLRKTHPDFTCAKVFWWYNMYSTADFSITPRPIYPADGRKVFDVYTHPFSIHDEIVTDLGPFPFPTFWGPLAGVTSRLGSPAAATQWIADAACWFERRFRPHLNLIYLPHLDYNMQRLGPQSPAIAGDLADIDRIVGSLIDFFQARDVEPVLLSEYGITPVDQPVHVNRLLRRQGWIAIKEELGRERLDAGASQAFAVADHQLAHVYVQDPRIVSDVIRYLESEPGIAGVLHGETRAKMGLDHDRAGDVVALAAPNAWFTYYYWEEDRVAPDFARCVDIHRKPGYDPVELFLDPDLSFPKLRIAAKLLRSKLGWRTLMNVIPLDAGLVRGSHGVTPADPEDYPVLVSPRPIAGGTPMASTDVHSFILKLFQKGS